MKIMGWLGWAFAVLGWLSFFFLAFLGYSLEHRYEKKLRDFAQSLRDEPLAIREFVLPPEQMRHIGLILSEENPVESSFWFVQAAGNGDSRAQFVVGMSYLHGRGFQPDPHTAANWIALSAANGDPLAVDFVAAAIAKF